MARKDSRRIAIFEESPAHRQTIKSLYLLKTRNNYEDRVRRLIRDDMDNFLESKIDGLSVDEIDNKFSEKIKTFSRKQLINLYDSLAEKIPERKSMQMLGKSRPEANEVEFFDDVISLQREHAIDPFPVFISSSNYVHILINDAKYVDPKTFFLVYSPTLVRGLDWTQKIDGHIRRQLGENYKELDTNRPIIKLLTSDNVIENARKRDYASLEDEFKEKDETGRHIIFFERDRE